MTTEFNAHVNRLTNYQRNQWARAGYPGLLHKDVRALRKFFDDGIGGGFFARVEEFHGPIWPSKPSVYEKVREIVFNLELSYLRHFYKRWPKSHYHPTKGWRACS